MTLMADHGQIPTEKLVLTFLDATTATFRRENERAHARGTVQWNMLHDNWISVGRPIEIHIAIIHV